MRKKEKCTLEARIKEKRRQIRANRKRKAAGQEAGSDGAISNWSQFDPEIRTPLVAREIQYECRIPKAHLQTIGMEQLPSAMNNKESMIGRSIKPGVDNASVQMSGMLVKKNQKIMTMNQYDLVPEIIYNSMEIQMRELVNTLISPTNYR